MYGNASIIQSKRNKELMHCVAKQQNGHLTDFPGFVYSEMFSTIIALRNDWF
jgi:hypothetical protein